MPYTAETKHAAYPDYVNLKQTDYFKASFFGKGHITKHYPGVGEDLKPSKFVGNTGINPDDSTPIFWLELSFPESARLSREATLADAISFSEHGLLQSLVAESVNKMLSKTE